MSDLLPCPFCGGEARIQRKGLLVQQWRVACLGCGASNDWLGQVMDCPTPPPIRRADAWNRRAHVPLPVDAPEPTPGAIAVAADWEPPEDREDGYRCLGLTDDGWVCVTWLEMPQAAPDWFTDWYPERDDKPTAFAPLPPLHTPGQIDLLCLSVQDVINGRLETGDAAADLAAVKEHLDTALKLTGFDGENG